MENLVRPETYRGTRRGQTYTEKMKHFSAEKDKSKYIYYLSQHNGFEIQIMSAWEIFVKH